MSKCLLCDKEISSGDLNEYVCNSCQGGKEESPLIHRNVWRHPCSPNNSDNNKPRRPDMQTARGRSLEIK